METQISVGQRCSHSAFGSDAFHCSMCHTLNTHAEPHLLYLLTMQRLTPNKVDVILNVQLSVMLLYHYLFTTMVCDR